MSFKTVEIRKEYFRARYKRLREEWLNKNGPCQRCGSSESLQVDHIDPSTKVTSDIWYWGEARRVSELAKCQVLCKKCHDEKSTIEQTTRVHGSLAMYRRGGCRCLLCIEAIRKYARDWKRKKSAKVLGA